MAMYGRYMAIYQLLFFGSLPNLYAALGYIWGHNFWTNQDLDLFSISKWPSEPQFCERWTYKWQKKWPERVLQQSFISIFHFQSEYNMLHSPKAELIEPSIAKEHRKKARNFLMAPDPKKSGWCASPRYQLIRHSQRWEKRGLLDGRNGSAI